jgi:hypothetical protein
MAAVKTIPAIEADKLSNFPNFHKSGSIAGMKKQYYGKDALLVKCGDYIYNVSSEPEIYRQGTASPVKKEKTPDFPNGFQSWMETHYEVVAHITQLTDVEGSIPNKRMEEQGTGGLYELAEELTNQFEELHKGREWDGEFFDEVCRFLEQYGQ